MDGAQPEKALNIYQRINEIKKAVAYVRKDKKVDGGGYMAVTHDAVTAETRQHFVDNGVVIVPCELESKLVDSTTVTGKGNPIMRFEAKYRIDFINADQPSDKVSVELTAHALDQGDKAPGKAHSYATKYAVLKILQLESGEDEEGREVQKPRKFADIPVPDKPITPTSGLWDELTEQQRHRLTDLATVMQEYCDDKDYGGAYEALGNAALDTDERAALLTRFDSKTRTAMTKWRKDNPAELAQA